MFDRNCHINGVSESINKRQGVNYETFIS
jgi:hypothetical protein